MLADTNATCVEGGERADKSDFLDCTIGPTLTELPTENTITKSLHIAREELSELIQDHKGNVRSALDAKFSNRHVRKKYYPSLYVRLPLKKLDTTFRNWYFILALLEYAYEYDSLVSTREVAELDLRDWVFNKLFIRFRISRYDPTEKLLTVVHIELHPAYQSLGIGRYILNCLRHVALKLCTPLMVECAQPRFSSHLHRAG